MSAYTAQISWSREGQVFTDNRYSRAHRWRFDGGIECPASSSPHVVPLPYSVAEAIDPEEAFVASLSSCHMLWFLSIAAKRGYRVDHYADAATGVMGANAEGHTAMLQVTLQPEVTFSGEKIPDAAGHEELHRIAHHECFIANSVRTEIFCRPSLKTA